MDIMSVDRPDWFYAAIAGTWLYTLIALIVARRASDARLVVAFPLLANTAVGSYAVFRLLQALAWAGDAAGPLTRAAGIAEALVPAFHGAVAGAFLGAVVHISRGLEDVRRRRRQAGSVALVLGAFVCAAWILLMWHLASSAFPSTPQLTYVALFLCLGATVVAMAVLMLGALPSTRTPREKSSPGWFLSFALVLAVVAVGLRLAEQRLQAFAAGGGA